MQMSFWQNCRYKLRNPAVQAWARWELPVPLATPPEVAVLPNPMTLELAWSGSPLLEWSGDDDDLPMDGGVIMITSYALAKQIAQIAKEHEGCIVKAFMCKTEPQARSQRALLSFDIDRPHVLFTDSHRHFDLDSANFVGGDNVLKQMLVAARSMPGGRKGRKRRREEDDDEEEPSDDASDHTSIDGE